MPANRINLDPIRPMIRHAVDMAVYSSVKRFSDDLGDKEHLTYQIAIAAADAAVETLTTHFNHELRLIQIDHEQRLETARRKPFHPMVFDALALAGLTDDKK